MNRDAIIRAVRERAQACPDCGGEGRIHGSYAQHASSLECETCAPQEPLPPFTQEELDAWEQSIEARNGYRAEEAQS